MRTILIPRIPTLCWLGPGESREERPPSRTVAPGPRRPEPALCPRVRRRQEPPTPRTAPRPLWEGRTCHLRTPRSSAQETSVPREATWTKNAPGIRPLAERIGPTEGCSGLSTLLVRPSGTPRPDTLRPRRCFTLF